MEGIQVAFLALHPSHLPLPSRLLPSGSPFLSNFHIEHQGSNPGLRLLLLDTDLHLPFFHSVDTKLSDSLTLLTSFKDPCIFCVSKWPITRPEPETLEPAKCFFLSSPQPVVTVRSLEFRLCKVISQFSRLNVLLQKLAELFSSDSSGLRGEQRREHGNPGTEGITGSCGGHCQLSTYKEDMK